MTPPAVAEGLAVESPHQEKRHVNGFEELAADEVRTAAKLTRTHIQFESSDELRFASISLLEPSGPVVDRRAQVVVQQPSQGTAHVLNISLTNGSVISSTPLGSAQAPLTPDDCELASDIVKGDASVLKVLEKRHGIVSAEHFRVDPWSVHVTELTPVQLFDGEKPVRLVQGFLYRMTDEADNQYAHPIDVVPVVDLFSRRVLRILGEEQPSVPIPMTPVNYHRDGVARNTYIPNAFGQGLRPLHVVQPEGPSFAVDGNRVSWHKWSFTVGFNYREGVVLHDVMWEKRDVLRRASVVEMAVPYFDPRNPFVQKCAFDVGDYGLGYCASSLSLGCDCLGHIRYFDATLANSKGEPYTVKNAICLHEEDAGISYKHVDYVTGHNESRRARRLVLSFIATVVNYEYLFYWYFNVDGSIDFEVKLSGELSTNVLSPGEMAPTHGSLVAPGVNAQYHQHMFCARIDPAVDGDDNTVEETDIVRNERDPKNPCGNAITVVRAMVTKERSSELKQARSWRINSSTRTNAITGRNTSYKLVPGTRGGSQPPILTTHDSAVTRRGQFATKALWVTRRNPERRFPAGEWPTQGSGGDGVAEWVGGELDTENVPLSLWHSFGIAHLPRVEDFPIMPCESVGFSLKPDGFFLGNPVVELPPGIDGGSAVMNGNSCCD